MLPWTPSFLLRGHAWRRSLDFDEHSENQSQPKKFTLVEVLEELEKVKDVSQGKHGASKEIVKRMWS
jgi:hypothetical protein